MILFEDFFRKPERSMLRISPGGSHLAYLEPYANPTPDAALAPTDLKRAESNTRHPKRRVRN